MKDRQRLFLEKIVKILVDETRINYENNQIMFPFYSIPSGWRPIPASFMTPDPRIQSAAFRPLFRPLSFFNYCRNHYGLMEYEVEYIWNEYKNIIKDKIKNNEG